MKYSLEIPMSWTHLDIDSISVNLPVHTDSLIQGN